MKILVDENIPLMTVQALRESGHDVLDIRGSADEGSADWSLWGIAQQQKRLLISTDKGFASHRDEFHWGMLIVRLRQPNREKIHRRVMRATNQFSADQWRGLLVTMRDVARSVWRSRVTG